MAQPSSDVGAAIDAVERLHVPTPVTLGNGKLAVAVPSGVSLQSLKPLEDEYRKRPERVRGTAVIETLDSLIAHVNRFKRATSAAFVTSASMRVVYDYHDQGADGADNASHQAVYGFPYSDAWQRWQRVNGQQLTQQRFAEFLEEAVQDIAVPRESDAADYFAELGFTLASPSTMLNLSRGLTVRAECEVVHKPNLSTGELEVSFKENHTDAVGTPLKIPGGFMLQIPPFVDGAAWRIPVRLRYKVSGGKVHWTVLLYRADQVRRDAIKEAVARFVEGTESTVPVFYGVPEATQPDSDDE